MIPNEFSMNASENAWQRKAAKMYATILSKRMKLAAMKCIPIGSNHSVIFCSGTQCR